MAAQRPINVTYAQLADVALTIMAEATIKATDEVIGLTQATRQMLRQIKSGELAVGQPIPDPPSKE